MAVLCLAASDTDRVCFQSRSQKKENNIERLINQTSHMWRHEVLENTAAPLHTNLLHSAADLLQGELQKPDPLSFFQF